MNDLVSCSRCGKLHPRGFKCNIGKINPKRTETDKLHDQRKWKRKANQIKADALGLCEVCRAEGVLNYDRLEVHHITKLRDDPSGLLDDYNLICLCVYHHKQADAGEIDADYLRELARERVNNAKEKFIFKSN